MLIDLGLVYEYAPGEAITSEGDLDTNVYILIEGILRKWYWDGDVEKTAHFGTAGTICVSYSGYALGLSLPINHESCSKSLVLKIKKEDYSALLQKSHEFSKWVVYSCFLQFAWFERKYNVIQGSAKERYKAFVKACPEIIQNVPLKTIASYLGITPQYLSNIRSKIK